MRRIDHVLTSQSSSHSFIRSEHGPFLRPGQGSQRHCAQRRSCPRTAIRGAAIRPARQRFTFDGREHDGRLSIPQDGDVHRCDPGSIDAVGRCSARRAGVVDYALAERFDRPSLRGICDRGVQALECARALDTRCHARRKRWQTASSIKKGAMGLMQIMPITWTDRVTVSLPSWRRPL
jgi:hypothetical protein